MSLLGKSINKVPEARLCHIIKWDGFDGYGFNLHAEKGKSGQYIGKVDEGSPSEAAGLKQGDRIVEVNEINISNETHKQVVERIKAFPNETKLLVVDQEADEYFKTNNIIIKGTLTNVRVIKTPEKNYSNDTDDSMDNDHRHPLPPPPPSSFSSSSSSSSSPTTIPTSKPATAPTPTTTTPSETIDDHELINDHSTNINNYTKSVGSNSSIDQVAQKSISSTDSINTAPVPVNNNSGIEQSRENGNRMADNVNNTNENNGSSTNGNGNGNGNLNVNITGAEQKSLNLKMSAKELRAQLAARKKFDPKKESMDFKLKFDIVQKL